MKKDAHQNPLLKFFASTKLTIIILILLGIASIIGTVVIQKGTGEEVHIHDLYSPRVIQVFEFLGFFNIYHSSLYIGLLALLTLNLLVCTYKRMPRDIKRRKQLKQQTVPGKLQTLKGTRKLQFSGGIDQTTTEVEKALKHHGYEFYSPEKNDLIAYRGEFGRFGFYIAHLGILVILMGGLISSLFTVEGMLWLAPGDSANTFRSYRNRDVTLDFTIRCDAFHIEKFPNGMVKEYRSDLTIKPNQSPPYKKKLLVNHPVSQSGFRIYQSSYSPFFNDSVKLQATFSDGTQQIFNLKIPGKHAFPKYGVTVEGIDFEPDFITSEDGKTGSRSNNFNNPAVRLRITEGANTPRTQWLFLKFPDFHGAAKSDACTIRFTDLNSEYATGIEISRDPGAPWIWIGSTILIVGLIVILLVIPQRLWIRIVPAGKKCTIFLGGAQQKRFGHLEQSLANLEQSISSAKSNK